jgi:hypothetical protein
MTVHRDTTPAPAPGVDPDTIDAFADDMSTIAMTLETAAFELAGLAVSLRRRAAEARTGKETGR